MSEFAQIIVDGKTYELPIIRGTENELAIDISKLRSQSGIITLDPGFKNTGSTKSAITFFEKLKEIIAYNKERWSVSQDVYSEEYDFIVVHGIRDLQEIKALKGLDSINTLLGLNTKDNFVTLSSEYRTYIKNKNWKNTSK